MITIPKNLDEGLSVVFAIFLVNIAFIRGYSWKSAVLSADPELNSVMLNQVADWLIDRYPGEFKRGE